MNPKPATTTTPRHRYQRFAIVALAVLPQAVSCSLFDGALLERTLTGTVFNPIAISTFETFLDLGASFAG